MNWAGDVMGLESMNLLRPLKVGPITLPNRVVMGSMHTGLEGHPERFDRLARFYAERAKGLVGLIVTGGFAPNFAGRMKDEPGTLESEDQVAAHNTVTSAVHAAGGRIVVQLLHAGGTVTIQPLSHHPPSSRRSTRTYRESYPTARSSKRSTTMRALPGLRRKRDMTASRSWGLRGTSSVSSSPRTPTSVRTGGAVNSQTAHASRSRS